MPRRKNQAITAKETIIQEVIDEMYSKIHDNAYIDEKELDISAKMI